MVFWIKMSTVEVERGGGGEFKTKQSKKTNNSESTEPADQHRM